jgi:hypothetical protein
MRILSESSIAFGQKISCDTPFLNLYQVYHFDLFNDILIHVTVQLDTVLGYLTAIPNLRTLGRHGLFSYANIDDADIVLMNTYTVRDQAEHRAQTTMNNS